MCFSFSPVLIHHERFSADSLVTLNYFGGGLLMAIAFGYPLWAGLRGALPPAKERSPLSAALPWHPPFSARAGLGLLGGVYVGLGLVFLMHGANAKPLWFDASGITPLTARLFASPLTGLGLGLILVARAKDSARGPCARSRHGDHRHSRHALAGARPRRFRAAKRRRMANSSDAAVAAVDRACSSDFQAVTVRWSTARLAALSRGSQPLRARVCRLNPTSTAEELVVPNRLGWCESESIRLKRMTRREPPQG